MYASFSLRPTLVASLLALTVSPQLGAQAGTPGNEPSNRTIQLLVEGSIDQVQVTSAWQRSFAYQEIRIHDAPTGWIRLYDAAGLELAKVHFDLSTVNRDRGARKGQTIVTGDMLLEGRITRLVKIPDYGRRLARLDFESIEGAVVRKLGSTSGDTLRRVLASTDMLRPLVAPTVRTHINNGPTGNRYDIVCIGDAYRAGDEARFVSDVNRWTANLFAKEPFKTYKNFFNVHSVFRASVDNLADKPLPCQNPPITRNTVYNASYCVGGTDRCLYIRGTTLASQDAALAPDVEGRIVVFVNDPKYGGCASTFAVSYNGTSGAEVQTHEFGHSFGGLADEYDYGRTGCYSGGEPGQANITKDPNCNKWSLWKGVNGVGCFEGAGYYPKCLFRPKSNCLMRSLGVALCEVCREELVLDGYTTVNPIENPNPTGTVTLTKPATRTYSFKNLVPPTSNPRVRWYVDNVLKQSGSSASFSFASSAYSAGTHTIRLEVFDQTAFVRKDTANKRTRTRTWSVIVKDGNAAGTYTTYGVGCKGSGAGAAQVLPRAYATQMGNSQNSFPFGRGNLRYQQVFLQSEAPSATYTGLAVRHGTYTGTNAGGTRTLTISLGHTANSLSGMSTTFDNNFLSGTKRLVLSGNVNLPSRTGANTNPNAWAVNWPFRAPFVHASTTGRNLLIEVVNRSTTNYNNYLDAASGGNTTRLYAATSSATTGTIGRGYGVIMRFNSGGVVALGNVGVPTLGRSFQITLANAPSGALAALWLGLTKTNIPLPSNLAPGCSLYASFEILPLAARVANANGFATVVYPIPNNVAFRGVRFFNEWFVVDKPANNLGLTFSNGGEAKVGG